MSQISFTTDLAGDQVQTARNLFAQVTASPSGLIDRARSVGYDEERIWIQPRPDGSAVLIVNIHMPAGVQWGTVAQRLAEYDSEWVRWFNPQLALLFGDNVPMATAPVFSWTDRDAGYQ